MYLNISVNYSRFYFTHRVTLLTSVEIIGGDYLKRMFPIRRDFRP